MKTIHKKRLLNVAKALRDAAKVPLLRKAFTMEFIGYEEESELLGSSAISPKGCGTPACALGHYAARSDLQKVFRLNKDGNLEGGEWALVAAEHFGLSHDEDEYHLNGECFELFNDLGCGGAKTPIQAAKYIEQFVARKEKEDR